MCVCVFVYIIWKAIGQGKGNRKRKTSGESATAVLAGNEAQLASFDVSQGLSIR